MLRQVYERICNKIELGDWDNLDLTKLLDENPELINEYGPQLFGAIFSRFMSIVFEDSVDQKRWGNKFAGARDAMTALLQRGADPDELHKTWFIDCLRELAKKHTFPSKYRSFHSSMWKMPLEKSYLASCSALTQEFFKKGLQFTPKTYGEFGYQPATGMEIEEKLGVFMLVERKEYAARFGGPS